MEILEANDSHIHAIFDLLKSVAADMRKQNIMQWNDDYPTLGHVQADVSNGIVYLGMEGQRIAGVISIDANQSPEYKAISWKYNAGTVMVVHRLAVSPNFQKKGVGRKLMDFALEKAIQDGYSSIRLDAFSQNKRTLKFYESRGYEKRGEIYFPYRDDPFYCFEKWLK